MGEDKSDDRDRVCDECGAGLVANPRPGETTSNKEWSVEHRCPNGPHTGSNEASGEPNSDKASDLKDIADKYF